MTTVTDGIPGDANRALTTILEDGSPSRRDNRSRNPGNLARFEGKSKEEIIDMYANLESHSGRLASQLGTAQSQLNEVIATNKRLSDLSTNQPTTQVNQPDVNGVDLIANPKQVLDRLIDDRVKTVREEASRRIAGLEARLAQVSYQANHKDPKWDDPTLVQFVQATPLRQMLNARAQQGDFSAADALLTEFEQHKRLAAASAETRNTPTLEGGNSSGSDDDKPAGKIYSRADIMALRVTDPDKYYSPEVQATLMQAYKDGRVR